GAEAVSRLGCEAGVQHALHCQPLSEAGYARPRRPVECAETLAVGCRRVSKAGAPLGRVGIAAIHCVSLRWILWAKVQLSPAAGRSGALHSLYPGSAGLLQKPVVQ